MLIRALDLHDAPQFRALRLQGLREVPLAFASSYEEESETTVEVFAERLKPNEGAAVFGAFVGSNLVGVAGLQREQMRKLSHKAFVWGVYVAPQARRAGCGYRLLSHVLSHAATKIGVRQVTLGVNSKNSEAIALYQKLGFVQFGLEQGYMLLEGQLHDEMHMVCVLAPDLTPPSSGRLTAGCASGKPPLMSNVRRTLNPK
jgi:ribosomal protein S18 acetylase RimI-like enzyme